MWKFYLNAAVCVIFLSDAVSERDLEKCKWFTRGDYYPPYPSRVRRPVRMTVRLQIFSRVDWLSSWYRLISTYNMFYSIQDGPCKSFWRRRSCYFSAKSGNIWELEEVWQRKSRLSLTFRRMCLSAATYMLEKKYVWRSVCTGPAGAKQLGQKTERTA